MGTKGVETERIGQKETRKKGSHGQENGCSSSIGDVVDISHDAPMLLLPRVKGGCEGRDRKKGERGEYSRVV